MVYQFRGILEVFHPYRYKHMAVSSEANLLAQENISQDLNFHSISDITPLLEY